jgi:hypothetical protein
METRALLQAFVDACADEVPLDPDHEAFLVTAKLLNESGEPTLKMYSLIAEDLKELLEG